MSHKQTNLREAHAHLPQLGRSMSMLDLSACSSHSEMIDLIHTRAEQTPLGQWILCSSVRVEAWDEPSWPTRQQLDAATGDKPCCAWSFDYHAMVVNTPGLEAAGFNEVSPDPPRGRIMRDEHGPTGLLLESAALQVWAAVPEPDPAQRRTHILAALAHLGKLGYTQVHDLKSPAWLGPMLAEICDEGLLELSVELFVLINEFKEVQEQARGFERDQIRLGGAKVFVDGTLNSRTAWMLEPFVDPIAGLACGQAMLEPGELENMVEMVDGLGYPLAAHAIGDGAVRAVLDAIQAKQPGTRGFRIEHAEVIAEQDVARFVELGVIASVQPCHLLTDIEVVKRALGERASRVLPMREMIDAGLTPGELLLFGSDVPIVGADPEDSIQAAVQRRRVDMGEAEALAPDQSISVDEAWACFGE